MTFFSTLLAQGNQVNFGDGLAPTSGIFAEDSKTGTFALSNTELLISRIVGILTTIGALFFIVYFIMGAISWISAGGDSSKVGKARDQMIQATLGLIVMVAAYGVIGIIGSVVGMDILNPAAQVRQLIPGTPNYGSIQPIGPDTGEGES